MSTLKTDLSNSGLVVSVGDGIARVYGLADARVRAGVRVFVAVALERVGACGQAGEIISFDNDIRGVALNLEYNAVGVVILGDDRYIREGSIAQRTRDMFKVRSMSVPCRSARRLIAGAALARCASARI